MVKRKNKKAVVLFKGIKCWVTKKGKVFPTNWKIQALWGGKSK